MNTALYTTHRAHKCPLHMVHVALMLYVRPAPHSIPSLPSEPLRASEVPHTSGSPISLDAQVKCVNKVPTTKAHH